MRYDWLCEIVRDVIPPLVGLLVAVFACEWCVTSWIQKSRTLYGYKRPWKDEVRKSWQSLTELEADNSGSKLLGRFERALFFFAAWQESYLLAGAWLAFKLGSKWQVWDYLVQVPETLDTLMDRTEYFYARHVWGSRLLTTFLVGTIANLIAGIIGAGVPLAVEYLLKEYAQSCRLVWPAA